MAERSLEAAAKSGNIDLLYELIIEDPYVLDKLDQVPFVDTPLHVAAAAGKTEFAMEMMNLKPSFARKLNAHGLTPLHLAVDHDHFCFALEVVKFDPSLIRLKGRQGMTPLLQAVSKKKMNLVSEFFLISPESIVDANVNGENAFHIAVNNKDQSEGLKDLKILMGWIQRLCQKDAELIETRVINRRDKDGNTALHLAAYENNRKAMKLMLKSSMINVNIENKEGLTVLDIAVLHTNGDMAKMVKKHGGKQRSVSSVNSKTTSDILGSRPSWCEKRRTRLIRSYSWISEARRNALLIVATLIITATYQTALQPPGGLRDSGESDKEAPPAPPTVVEAISESRVQAPPGSFYDNGEGSADALPGDHSGESSAEAPPGYVSSVKAGTVVIGEGTFTLLWLSNSAGLYLATALTLRLLSLGQESVFWYYPLFFPLLCAYFIAGIVISPDSVFFVIAWLTSLILLVLWGYVVSFWEWVQSKRIKMRQPKSALVWEGITTFDQAKGLAPKGYVIRW
ncbi:hypothetical protein AALP_AA8G159500 [Arabis alpina]|uniref:PGG domain-containing protein n=1 Tax=Arabis alpina TaxID=50452 RepID=A0A087G7C9_ARAAL|nr:hypothetical protein AALP_AA8G159500 [Arabis alpina]